MEHARLTIRMDIDRLSEQMCAAFLVREEELRGQVRAAIEAALSDDQIAKAIKEEVRREFDAAVRRETAISIRKAIDEKLGSDEWRAKLEKVVSAQLKRMPELK